MNEHRSIQEAYQVAGNSANLRFDTQRHGDVDVLIAAGWTPGRLGAAALRLRGEWDRIARPRLLSRDVAAQFVAAEGPQALERIYTQQLQGLAEGLRSFQAVVQPLTARTGDAALARAVLFWWLAPQCTGCGGTKWMLAKGSGHQGNKVCRACQGAGLATIPHGQAGRKAANYLDDCVQNAQALIKKRLRSFLR